LSGFWYRSWYVFADAHDDQDGRLQPPVERGAAVTTEELGYSSPRVLVRDDHEPLALAEAGARRAPDRADDALDRFPWNRLRFIGPHHPAPF